MGFPLSAVGAVCERCESANEPGEVACRACGAPLAGALWVKEIATGGSSPNGRPEAPSATAGTPGPRPVSPTPGPAYARAPDILSPPVAPVPGGTPGPASRSARTPGPAAWSAGTPGPAAAIRPSDPPVIARDVGVPPRAGWTPPLQDPGHACPRCGRSSPAKARFCTACGLQLDAAGRAEGSVRAGSARLVLLRGVGSSGTSFPLRDETTQAGRAAALRLAEDDTLPAVAATFLYRDGRLFVRDEGGPSGVFVRLTAPAILGESEDFSLGDKLLRFLGKVPPTPPAASGSTRLLGSARPGSGPHLRLQVLRLGGIPGRIYARPAPLRIGRALGEILFADDPFVSARHCEIELDPAGAILRDLGSSNGTFLRVPRRGERELRAGDTIRLGRNVFRVE